MGSRLRAAGTVFNPLASVYLTRAIWLPVDVVAALTFVSGCVSLRSHERYLTNPYIWNKI